MRQGTSAGCAGWWTRGLKRCLVLVAAALAPAACAPQGPDGPPAERAGSGQPDSATFIVIADHGARYEVHLSPERMARERWRLEVDTARGLMRLCQPMPSPPPGGVPAQPPSCREFPLRPGAFVDPRLTLPGAGDEPLVITVRPARP